MSRHCSSSSRRYARRSHAPLLLVFALAAAAVLPWYAFYQGHPLRIRYGLPLVAACAVMTATGIGLLWRAAAPSPPPRRRGLGADAVVAVRPHVRR